MSHAIVRQILRKAPVEVQANSIRSSTNTDFRPDASFTQWVWSRLALIIIWHPGHLKAKSLGKKSFGVCFSASPPLSRWVCLQFRTVERNRQRWIVITHAANYHSLDPSPSRNYLCHRRRRLFVAGSGKHYETATDAP